jgi:hypothetical protein
MGNMLPNVTSNVKAKDSLTKLFFLYVLYQLILHAYFALSLIEKRIFLPTALAFFQDISILGITAAIGHGVKSVSSPKLKKTVDVLFSIILIMVGIALASYPRILREYLTYSVNIFDSDLNSAQVFISDYLGIDAFLPSLIALFIGVAVLCFKKQIHISKKVKLSFITIVALGFSFSLMSSSPNPFVYSIQQKIEIFLQNKPRVVTSLSKISPKDSMDSIQTLSYTQDSINNYDHIFVVVMEGVTSKEFEDEFFPIENGFFQSNKENSVYYRNFYTSNLDSYTSLISMVTSIQVPFRAYADESLFTKVNEAPSLAKDLQNRGFFNLFLSTYEYQPFVPTRKHWNKIYERKDLPTIKGWLSLESNRMESATEDKAAIPTMIEIMKTNENTFILHELVYGHSTEWKAVTGINKVAYYDSYLVDLSKEIEKAGLLDNTLFVVVSDHGDRSKSANLENYRVPLYIVGAQDSSRVIEGLVTHTDVPSLIYHHLGADQDIPLRDEMLLVGSTEKWVYGKMNKKKEYIFIDDASGTILSQEGNLDPNSLQLEFQNHVNKFNRLYGKEYPEPIKN